MVFLFLILLISVFVFFFFFSSRRRHTRSLRDWSSDVCSSDLAEGGFALQKGMVEEGRRGHGEAAGFEVASLVKKNDGLIQVDEPGPDFVFLLDEQGTRLRE